LKLPLLRKIVLRSAKIRKAVDGSLSTETRMQKSPVSCCMTAILLMSHAQHAQVGRGAVPLDLQQQQQLQPQLPQTFLQVNIDIKILVI
jgi:hypothetical protein